MAADLPEFYFRIRENGAVVFRVDSENRQSRLELDPVATVNIRNGKINPQGGRTLSEHENAAIAEWMEARKAELDRRQIDDIHRTIDHLNLTTQWAQSRARDDELDQVTDALLLAMHDLRTVLVRAKAERLMRDSDQGPSGDED
ncbi:hypothetical protein C2I36_11245 [Rhodobacteraceae bacterium WD3A24]|nr:hypothetical protein C2I36_11245 [Rhodobacteraceae bacterium WD3A24]